MTDTNADRLRGLLADYRRPDGSKIRRKDVAQILDVSLYTVLAWLKPPTSKSHRPMPDRMLRLLELELQARKVETSAQGPP